jgi:hypothetical protein
VIPANTHINSTLPTENKADMALRPPFDLLCKKQKQKKLNSLKS